MSKTLNASTVRSTSTIEIDGTSIGSMIERKMRGQLARSTFARLVELARDRREPGEQEERDQRRGLPHVGEDHHVERQGTGRRATTGSR